MSNTLFRCDLDAVELFLGALKDRQLRRIPGSFLFALEPEPATKRALAAELHDSVQGFLATAYVGAKQRWDADGKMCPAHWPVACDECRSWLIQTTQAAKKRCAICGHKPDSKGRRRLEIPWADASRGRPRATKPRSTS